MRTCAHTHICTSTHEHTHEDAHGVTHVNARAVAFAYASVCPGGLSSFSRAHLPLDVRLGDLRCLGGAQEASLHAGGGGATGARCAGEEKEGKRRNGHHWWLIAEDGWEWDFKRLPKRGWQAATPSRFEVSSFSEIPA
eukprot:6194970-Pleurochrysis_carterae.AAC.3